MERIRFICALMLAVLLSASAAHAASTSVGLAVGRGSSKSTSISLNITQRYEAWLDTSLFSLSPLAELGGHVWIPDSSDADSVWGGYLAPGLRFSLFTDSSIQPYLEGSVGGAVNTKDRLDDRRFGSHALFRTRGSVGVSFGEGLRHRVQWDYINYSTWGITDTNAGYNSYGLSYGFSF